MDSAAKVEERVHPFDSTWWYLRFVLTELLKDKQDNL